jgi:beta-xylosidase
VSASPGGPYHDASTDPITCDSREAIDPEPVVGTDGHPVLLWKRGRPAAIWAQALTSDGLALTGPEHLLLRADRGWEGSNVEAPSMLVTAGGSWLFFSANDWSTSHYAIGAVRCSGPLGPCASGPAGPILASSGSIIGPGGASVFQDSPGHYSVAYHAYVAPHVGYPSSRLFFVGRVSLGASSPVIVG